MRLPVAAKMALESAGMIGGSAGSPRPVGELSVSRKWTSTGGPAFIYTDRRSGRVSTILGYPTHLLPKNLRLFCGKFTKPAACRRRICMSAVTGQITHAGS